jgi:hypothetical protein
MKAACSDMQNAEAQRIFDDKHECEVEEGINNDFT